MAASAHKIRIEIEKFINVKGKIIFFGEKKPLTALSSSKILDVFKLMAKKEKRILILTSEDKFRIQGIVATRDICQFLLQGASCDYCAQFPSHYHQIYEQPISAFMNTAVIKLEHQAPLFIGIEIMVQQNKGTLPLIDHHGDLRGIITERHIAFLLADTKKNVEVRVKDIMTPNPITCTPSQTIGDALGIICREGFRRLPVVQNEKLVGYFTVKDLLHYFIREEIVKSFKNHQIDPVFLEQISSIMKSPVITIGPEASVTECAHILKKRNIGALPVVEGGKLIGIITEHDLVKAMAIET